MTGRVVPGEHSGQHAAARNETDPHETDPRERAAASDARQGRITGTAVALGGWRRHLRRLAAVVCSLVIVVILATQWRDVRPLLGELSAGSAAGAAIAVFVGIFGTFLCWRAILTTLGSRPPLTAGMRVFFVGQLAKYVPGAIWPAVTQIELGRDYRVPARASGAAVIVFLLTIFGTGLLVAAPTLPLLAGEMPSAYWWTMALLPVAAVALLPPVTNRLIGLALKVLRRPALPQPLTFSGMLRAAGWSIAAWLCYGVHALLIVDDLGTVAGIRLLAILTGAFAAAFCMQFLLPVGPAGTGVREAALILLLAGALPKAQAIVFAVLSRLMFTLGDVAWTVAALTLERWRRLNRGR